MADSDQHNPHEDPDLGPDSADAGQSYFDTIGESMQSLASTAHQPPPHQQGVTVSASSYGTEIWQHLLHDQQQAQQLYNQYEQAPAGYHTSWSPYGNTFSPELQGYVHPEFQNQSMLQQLQQAHQSGAQPVLIGRANISQNSMMQQQHMQIAAMQNSPIEMNSQQIQYTEEQSPAPSILQTLQERQAQQQQAQQQHSQRRPSQQQIPQQAKQHNIQKPFSQKPAPRGPETLTQQSHQSPMPTAAPSASVPRGTGSIELSSMPTQSTQESRPGSMETSTLSSPLSNIDDEIPQVERSTAQSSTSKTPLHASMAHTVPDSSGKTSKGDLRPKTSIPQNLTAEEYAKQCNQAAINSRLSPYFLHHGEYQMLRNSINHHHVTTYLNIRNGILRLWQRNPLVSVTREEAAGCAKDYRFLNIAEVAYEWLVRNGYINFGCVEAPNTLSHIQIRSTKRKKILIIGAGISGLSCARQLESLFQQLGDQLEPDEGPPEIVVLEARCRIGGRVYSHPLKNQDVSSLGPTKRATADLGAQIITGFDNGNPLNVLVRGQLALDYHSLKDNSRIYDIDGKLVDKESDSRTERLFNDILDRVAIFKLKSLGQRPIEGDRDLIDEGKDPAGDGGRVIAKIEENEVELPPMPPSPLRGGGSPFSAVVDRLTGKPTQATGTSATIPVVEQLRKLGWEVKDVPAADSPIVPKACGTDPRYPTLGKTMDELLLQYQSLLKLSSLDLRLINWHYANLEYANAATVEQLSLGSWDQDDGNEFRGSHAMLIGGYTQVPRGLWLRPRKLDVRVKHAVTKIFYKASIHSGKAVRVECENGAVMDADKAVITIPLGVLKSNDVEFEPPLPPWKRGAIERLGYGLLNKVVMVFDEPFWDTENDMTGLLQSPISGLLNQASYEIRRGRFYLFWNCTKVSGRPMLVALMAGGAAYQAEQEDDVAIIKEAVAELTKIYPEKHIPYPSETIITRWRKDKYSRGSYSYVGPAANGEDYNAMARPVNDTIFFAGEATCGTHPATVHGAYISGLKAAADVAESLLGPIKVPAQLIPPKLKHESSYSSVEHKRKAEKSAAEKAKELRDTRLEKYEEQLKDALYNALGERPVKPGRTGANPFLLYQKDHWFICKAKCDEVRRQATGNPEAKATRNEVRAALGLMWREAPGEEKRPYLEATETNKKSNTAAAVDSKKRMQQWDHEAEKFKAEWRQKNPSIPNIEEAELTKQAELEAHPMKRNKKPNGHLSDSN